MCRRQAGSSLKASPSRRGKVMTWSARRDRLASCSPNRRRRRHAALSLERLETRTLLDAAASQQFVTQAFSDLLHRGVDGGALAYFTNSLETGAVSRAQVALSIEYSPESLVSLVGASYMNLLGRAS